MQGNRQINNTKITGKMPACFRNGLNQKSTDVRSKSFQFIHTHFLQKIRIVNI